MSQTMSRLLAPCVALTVAGILSACSAGSSPDPSQSRQVAVDEDDIGGVVTSANGPEAGVWVIAETSDLPTRFAKIVVTDEAGRYLVPDLPPASYKVWVRGYGLADSQPVESSPGRLLDLTAVVAPDAQTAAKVYPAAYWYAMMRLPQESEVAHLRGGRNEYLMWVKNMGCIGCHQLGQLSTRTLPPSLGKLDSAHDAWVRRIQSGQAGPQMLATAMGQLGGVPMKYMAEWGSVAFQYPGALLRFDPRTQLSELYTVPLPGFGVRGADIDRNGVVWVSLGSGHLGEFDRRKCKGPLNGPTATGTHCPEGWSFHNLPGPGFAELPEFSVESSYYTWVDQHDTLGLGANVPMVTGNLFDGIHARVDGRFVTLRIPYPLGFYTKGFEGRIDDAEAGWKGRGLWVPSADRTPWLKEGGQGTKPLVVHFQMRPDPLAK
jgi:hypothetical protein